MFFTLIYAGQSTARVRLRKIVINQRFLRTLSRRQHFLKNLICRESKILVKFKILINILRDQHSDFFFIKLIQLIDCDIFHLDKRLE